MRAAARHVSVGGCPIASSSLPCCWLQHVRMQSWRVRIHKSDLSLRPIWHQKVERVQAHILVCFLAYVLWKTLEQWQQRAGLGNSPRTILNRSSFTF